MNDILYSHLIQGGFMKKGYLFYSSVKRLIEKYAHFNSTSDYEKFVMELAEIFKI
jgi:hypothetical protein